MTHSPSSVGGTTEIKSRATSRCLTLSGTPWMPVVLPAPKTHTPWEVDWGVKGDRILGSSTSIYRAQARVGHPMCVRPWFSRSLLGKGQHVLKSTLLSVLVTPHRLLFVKAATRMVLIWAKAWIGFYPVQSLASGGPASGGGRRTWSKL